MEGIKLTAEGLLLESAISNIVLITKDSVFVAPLPDNIVYGITMRRVMMVV